MVQTTLADYVRIERFAYRPGAGQLRTSRAADWVAAVPLGDGFIDFAAFFAGLREGGFDGYVAYEMCSPRARRRYRGQPRRRPRKSLAVIQRLMARPLKST